MMQLMMQKVTSLGEKVEEYISTNNHSGTNIYIVPAYANAKPIRKESVSWKTKRGNDSPILNDDVT